MQTNRTAFLSTAEKIVLVEKLWDDISKKEIEINDDLKNVIDSRLESLEKGASKLYKWNEIKHYIQTIRK